MSATEIPGYKIIRTLGVGGQATVYLAIQQGFEREVALKVMSPALAADPTFGDRFVREAKIVAKLSHKSIVTVYDVGESGNFFYLAMEYLPGGDLKSKISEGIKTRECLAIIGKLAKALNFAHEKGYIHRDVKSENILFDEDGEPVLTDFGIAKASNSSTQMTQTGKLIGTPEYMSPEQCRGKQVDGRSDLYSLGIILFEMLTRQVPFSGEDSVAVCIKHVTKPLPQLPARLKHIQWLLDSLLAKDPAKRFQSGNELATAVINFDSSGRTQASIQPQIKSAKPAKKVAKQEYEKEDFSAFNDEPDNFDDLRTERRYQMSADEEKGSLKTIIVIILIALVVGGGYATQDKWYEQSLLWVNKNILGKTSAQKTTGRSSPLSPTAQELNKVKETNTSTQAAPTPTQLLQEADSLLQFVPQQLGDIKKALKLVATVKTLEPGNKNADRLYQNILSTSLMQATSQAEKNNFQNASDWLALVQYEEPGYQLLEATRNSIQKMQQDYESKQSSSSQKIKEVEQLLQSAQLALKENRLSSPQDSNAIALYQSVLAVDPGNVDALQGLSQVALAYEGLIENAIDEQSFSKAKAFLSRFNNLSDDQAKKLALRQKIAQAEKAYSVQLDKKKQRSAEIEATKKAEAERIARLNDPMVQMRLLGSLDSAKSLESHGDLVLPEGNNALEKYRSVLQIDDRNSEALSGIARIEKTILNQLTESIASGDKLKANNWLTQLKLFKADHPQYASFATAVSEILETIPAENDSTSVNAAPPEKLNNEIELLENDEQSGNSVDGNIEPQQEIPLQENLTQDSAILDQPVSDAASKSSSELPLDTEQQSDEIQPEPDNQAEESVSKDDIK